MKFVKHLFVPAALAICAGFASDATASDCGPKSGHGIYVESIVMRESTTTVRYGHKNKGCAILIDKKKRKAQNSPKYFCAHGADLVSEVDNTSLKVFPGRQLRLCTYNPRKGLSKKRCTGKFTVREAGDLNGDGGINVADLYLMYHHIMDTGVVETWPEHRVDEDAADINGDDDINVLDLVKLISIINS